MIKTAKARTDPADIINSAVDALIRYRFELPALIALRRLAGTAHSKVNAAQWGAVCGHLDDAKQSALEALLVVDPTTQKSPFADLCRAPGRASRKNLKALIDRYHWLEDPRTFQIRLLHCNRSLNLKCWAHIRENYEMLMQLALAVQSGILAPSAVLARINSYSTRNRVAFALQELGKAVRTKFLTGMDNG
jgi:hypothetical protein